MRHRHGGQTRAGEKFFQPEDALDVQVVGWLVQQQQLRIACQRPRQRDALAPAARQLAHRTLGPRGGAGQIHLGDQRVDARLVIAGQQAFTDHVVHRGRGVQRRRLRQVSHAQASPPSHLAVVRRQRAGQDLQQRGLAGAVRANQPHPIAVRQREADRREQGARAKGVPQLLRGEKNGHVAPNIHRPPFRNSTLLCLVSCAGRMRDGWFNQVIVTRVLVTDAASDGVWRCG